MTCPRLELVAWHQNNSGPSFWRSSDPRLYTEVTKFTCPYPSEDQEDGRWTYHHSQTFQKRMHTTLPVCDPKVPTLILLLGCPGDCSRRTILFTEGGSHHTVIHTHTHLHFPNSQKLFIISNKKSLAPHPHPQIYTENAYINASRACHPK